jgi:hypothetical protein
MLVKLEVDWGGTGALRAVLGWVLMGRSMLRSEAEVEGDETIERDAGGVFSSAETGPATVTTVSEAIKILIASNSKP